jgi:hypothetical protein
MTVNVLYNHSRPTAARSAVPDHRSGAAAVSNVQSVLIVPPPLGPAVPDQAASVHPAARITMCGGVLSTIPMALRPRTQHLMLHVSTAAGPHERSLAAMCAAQQHSGRHKEAVF